MQFLKTLFWVVVAALAVIFAYRNWVPAEIELWGGLEADVKLPVLLLIAFLLGYVPLFLVHKASRWRQKRKLDNVQRALEEARAQLALQDPATFSADADGPAGATASPLSSGPQPTFL